MYGIISQNILKTAFVIQAVPEVRCFSYFVLFVESDNRLCLILSNLVEQLSKHCMYNTQYYV